jgi:hypothetical protein
MAGMNGRVEFVDEFSVEIPWWVLVVALTVIALAALGLTWLFRRKTR